MKICWDMLEGVRLTRNDTFRKGKVTYIYKEACAKCGEPYLIQSSRRYLSSFCGRSCAKSGENNPFFGKKHLAKAKKKISERSYINQIGSLSSSWKGDKAGFTMYNTYKDKLGPYEVIRKQKDTEMLEARCAYCNQWYTPKYSEVTSRLKVVNMLNQGEGRLYCSDNCKQSCPTYGRRDYPKGFKKATSREVSTYLRQMVFERDNWICQKCGNTIEEVPLHVHHMDPVAQNPMFQNDMDSCVTLCKDCHKEVHMQYGCRYVDLRCKRNRINYV